jgi:hypothetical protein
MGYYTAVSKPPNLHGFDFPFVRGPLRALFFGTLTLESTLMGQLYREQF